MKHLSISIPVYAPGDGGSRLKKKLWPVTLISGQTETIGIVWQCTLTIIPMYLVVREQLGLWSSIALLLVTTLILRKTWYKPLCKEEARYNEEMKQLK